MVKLSDITSIYSGIVFWGEKKPYDNFRDFPVVQGKDIDDNNRVNWAQLSRAVLQLKKQEHIIRQGDILVRCKGLPHIAVLADSPKEDTVAGSQFFVVRAKNDLIFPDFLAWYMNQSPAQRYLNLYSAGTNIKHINKKVLSALEVAVPSLEIQKKVVQVHNLWQKENEILEQIKHKKEQVLQSQLLNLVQNK